MLKLLATYLRHWRRLQGVHVTISLNVVADAACSVDQMSACKAAGKPRCLLFSLIWWRHLGQIETELCENV